MKKILIITSYIIICGVIVFLYFHFDFGNKKSLAPQVLNGQTQKIIIEKGDGLKDIGDKLQKAGLVNSRVWFELYALFTNSASKFLPGEYQLSKNLGLGDIIKTILSQGTAIEETITIPEGWTNKEIASFLEAKKLGTTPDFYTAMQKIQQEKKYNFLQDIPEDSTLEGFLFPDTYRVYKKGGLKPIIEKMLENFDKKVDAAIRANIKSQKKTLYEVVTLASIVEKEAAIEQDKRIIAGIFLNRLKFGQKLESCATINYILGESKKHLSIEDTKIPSPYNTYLNKGLPKGPVDNPGLVSMQAVLNPLWTDYLYFLTSGDGKTIFSRTYEEHLKNKEKYLN